MFTCFIDFVSTRKVSECLERDYESGILDVGIDREKDVGEREHNSKMKSTEQDRESDVAKV